MYHPGELHVLIICELLRNKGNERGSFWSHLVSLTTPLDGPLLRESEREKVVLAWPSDSECLIEDADHHPIVTPHSKMDAVFGSNVGSEDVRLKRQVR